MIYFQGTDNTLWRLNPDGSGSRVAGFKCSSPPVAYGDKLYFQGIDNKLWQCNLDGSDGIVLGNNTTSASPYVTATGIYFRGTDNKLWVIDPSGNNQVNLGGNTTSSTPFVLGQYVFFRGTDNRLWRMLIDGTQGINLGTLQTSSSPTATAQYVYFRGTDDKLWRVNLDGTSAINLGGGYKCSSTPCVAGEYVYFQGTDNTLWRTDLNGNYGLKLGGWKCKATPVIDLSQNYIYFQGTDNALWRIHLDGSNGVHLGGFNTASTPFVVQPSNQPSSASGVIPYMVLLLVYAPPGTNGGKSNSQVQYAAGSTVGSTVSYTHSVNSQWGVTASVGGADAGGAAGSGSGGGASGGHSGSGASGGGGNGFSLGLSNSQGSGMTAALDIRNSSTSGITVTGPGADGINHDYDQVWILLNPKMNVVLDPHYNMNWSLDFTDSEGNIVYLNMKWLKDLTLFADEAPDTLARCERAGMTASDFAQLLSFDSFATGGTVINQTRYVLTNLQVTYQPPADATAPVVLQPNTLTYATTNTIQNTSSDSWSFSIGGSLGKVLDTALKVSGSIGWTNSTTTAETVGETQTVTLTIGGPAIGYKGPTRLRIYQDVLYGTLMFYLSDDEPTYSGVLLDSRGQPAANTPVQLTIGSQKLVSWTDARGNYHFYDTPKGKIGEVTAIAHPLPGGGLLHGGGRGVKELPPRQR